MSSIITVISPAPVGLQVVLLMKYYLGHLTGEVSSNLTF